MTARPRARTKDKRLFTPGPLTTSYAVKQAMLRDLGSRDREFIALVRNIRHRLLHLAGVTPDDFCTVIMQGSGTFAVESVISSTVPPGGALLVPVNGAYGQRMVDIARALGIRCMALTYPEDTWPAPLDVAEALDSDPSITHVAMVHCETTTGIVNPIATVGQVARTRGRGFIVDAMSSFGGIPMDIESCAIDYLVTSPNKCLESVPGFGLILARRRALEAARGLARSYSLDLVAQADRLEADGQFRFTPPTHALIAFRQALEALECEGGITARSQRYQENYRLTLAGMVEMGFEPYLPSDRRGPIITAFRYPRDRRFVFEAFYRGLSRRGHIIYPGKVSRASCFRIGHIGHIFAHDVAAMLNAVQAVTAEMGLPVSRTLPERTGGPSPARTAAPSRP